MTTTIIIGNTKEKAPMKPIEFRYFLKEKYPSKDHQLGVLHKKPRDFKFIELICLNYIDDTDLMFAYNDPDYRNNGMLIVGKWNDGVVE